eukprot:TRINITY_DN27008_c0_g1_i1.p1 TRINITY_DN27008_c0_g1~~TRINITY_DN27008_c0_g1_i1.p1  ORF type:complete len:871 (-),score=117.01 TRINITY_DN27008_c0_g1_i1:40-2652(-)
MKTAHAATAKGEAVGSGFATRVWSASISAEACVVPAANHLRTIRGRASAVHRPSEIGCAVVSVVVVSILFAGRVVGQAQVGHLSSITSLSYGYLATFRSEFCQGSSQEGYPPKLNEQAEYPASKHELQQGHSTRGLVQQWRGESRLVPIARKCSLASNVGATAGITDAGCNAELSDYVSDLLMYALPVVLGFLTIFVWHLCCWVACCRCCRRCCLCAERKSPRKSRAWQRIVAIVVIFIGSMGVSISAIVAFQSSGIIHVALTDTMCQLMTSVDEALNGSPKDPSFLGVDVGIHRIQMVRHLLDVDSNSMLDVRSIMDETVDFANAVDDLHMKIGHMSRVLTLVAQHKIKEHSCVFCTLVLGNNATGEMGLLNELVAEVKESSAEAMRTIQATTQASLMGDKLALASSAVRRGGMALETFRNAYISILVDGVVSSAHDSKAWEDARHTMFMVLAGFCLIQALGISGAAVWHAQRSRALYPSASMSCVAWFFGFCTMSLALIFAGCLFVLAVPLSELCALMRYDLMTYEGASDYYMQLGLADLSVPTMPIDPVAVNVFRSCLTPNGTGDILSALQLRQALSFQQVIDDQFVQLDRAAGRVIDSAKFDLLTSQAATFGGLFVLDPDVKLPLEPSAASKMMGSSLDPDDHEGPDGESLIYGLNTYAQLIDGPGRYSFANGTSGGGTLITATSPSDAETSKLPLPMQHALIYARMKAQILTEQHHFHCDSVDAAGRITERRCGYADFKRSVSQWAQQVHEAGLKLGEASKKAYPMIASDLRLSLRGLLMEVRELSTQFRCRFLWRRWEDFDFRLCNAAVPGILQCGAAWMVLAFFALVLLVAHYKIWRHLLDNKIVGAELERYSKQYGYLQVTR